VLEFGHWNALRIFLPLNCEIKDYQDEIGKPCFQTETAETTEDGQAVRRKLHHVLFNKSSHSLNFSPRTLTITSVTPGHSTILSV
jgi:hypothetical protein